MEFHQSTYNDDPSQPPPGMDWGAVNQPGMGFPGDVHQRSAAGGHYGGGGWPPPPPQQQQQQPHPHVPPMQPPPTQQQQPAQPFAPSIPPELMRAAAGQIAAGWGIPGGFPAEVLNGIPPTYPGVPEVRSWFERLKSYFRVTNSYVLSKLKVLSFPFTHNYQRQQATHMSMGSKDYEYEAPSRDVNGMDLYIPCMALITYVLLSAAIMGANKNFKPEVLGSQTTWCVAVSFLEVIVLYLACPYFGMMQKLAFCDAACMSGYKYVGICICLLSRFLLPSPFWMVPFAWFSACTAFLVRAQLMEHFKDFKSGRGHVVTRAQPLLLAAAAAQPFIYLFLTSNVVGD